jgi:hypothetical protein
MGRHVPMAHAEIVWLGRHHVDDPGARRIVRSARIDEERSRVGFNGPQ